MFISSLFVSNLSFFLMPRGSCASCFLWHFVGILTYFSIFTDKKSHKIITTLQLIYPEKRRDT